MYGAFLRHVATFESLAEANEAKGESGAPYRNAIMNKFGLTAAEQTRISTIANTYQARHQALRQQLKAEIKNFQALNFSGNKHISSTPTPTKSPTLISLAKQIRQTTLQARDQVHAALGDTRFAQVDTQIRARATHDFSKISRNTK